ncbi:MAG: TM2 domain-containing protein [Bacteroidota bacterium]|jgi:TM2 domain-containing membrane protein YozV
MDSNKIEMFIATSAQKFPAEKIAEIRQKLEQMDDNKFLILQSIQLKDPTTLLIISLLAGSLGVDRFMLGDTGLGVAKLLTGGGCGIWTIVDWFTVMDRTRLNNYQKFMQMAM